MAFWLDVIGSVILLLTPLVVLNLFNIINEEWPDLSSSFHLSREVVLGFALGSVFCLGAMPVLFTSFSWMGLSLAGAVLPVLLGVYLVYRNRLNIVAVIIGTVLVALLSFHTTHIDLEMGIVSSFPEYLYPVFLALVISIIFSIFTKHENVVPLSFSITAFGVLLGADLVRIPELVFKHHATGIIGGARTFDLVLVAPLLSFLFSFLYLMAVRRYIGLKSQVKTGKDVLATKEDIEGISNHPGHYGAVPSHEIQTLLLKAQEYLRSGSYSKAVERGLEAVKKKMVRVSNLLPQREGEFPGDMARRTLVYPDAIHDGQLLETYSNASHISYIEGYRALVTVQFLLGVLDETRQKCLGGIRKRCIAFLFDQACILLITMLIYVIFYLCQFIFGSGFNQHIPLPFVIFIILSSFVFLQFFYFLIFETLWHRTPGKKIVGIYVCSVDGGKLNIERVFARTVGRHIEMVCGLFFLALVTMRLSPEDQRIGDMLGGTIVLNEECSRY